jgi:hypothetical protein
MSLVCSLTLAATGITCIFSLFNDAVNNSNYIAMNEWMVANYDWKGCGIEQSWPTFKVLAWHLLGWTEKNHKNLSHDS